LKVKDIFSLVLVTHACNPSSEGRRLNPDQTNGSQEPILKKTITKKGLVEWLKL
jgi:hypothetical protein